jgi:prefoldin subunit 5
MSALGEALAALRKVILLDDNVARLQQDVADLANEIRRIREYAAVIDRRVGVLEGTIHGYNMARAEQPRLPPE